MLERELDVTFHNGSYRDNHIAFNRCFVCSVRVLPPFSVRKRTNNIQKKLYNILLMKLRPDLYKLCHIINQPVKGSVYRAGRETL